MKFSFKIQPYQTEAVNAVVNVFQGQEHQSEARYRRDLGKIDQSTLLVDDIGYKNSDIWLSNEQLLKNLHAVQQDNSIKNSTALVQSHGKVSLDIEMETGTGKTYAYIKTIFELHKRFGFCKFVVVVPSIAIREGVKKSFEITQDHFMEHYRKKARFFVYDSGNLTALDNFSKDNNINVMIINMQAFAASLKEEGKQSKEARIIFSKRDNFASRRPIDVLAANRPILILDEPQRMGGVATQAGLKLFNPLFTLNYSATHKTKNNRVYLLSPVDAYNKKLVKRIEVKGFEVKHLAGTGAYFYLEDIILSQHDEPKARLEVEVQYAQGIKRERRIVSPSTGDMFILSKNLEQYKGYTLAEIDPHNNCIRFTNGETVYKGEVIGDTSEETKRRIQIRETILSHFEKEEKLFAKGIKVLSLFFIDEVAKYRQYDAKNNRLLGEYGKIFEEEYANIVYEYMKLIQTPYTKYLERVCSDIQKVHDGYFSVDKQGKAIDSSAKKSNEWLSDDTTAYDLILKNKERLLSLEEPTRFIFSHSALREGWDNPNVFQICTLKNSDNTDNKRQEVGRGLRICVDKYGERMDFEACGEEVHEINKLTVIASESYTNFVTDLQRDIHKEMQEIDRPTKANAVYFTNKIIKLGDHTHVITEKQAKLIERSLITHNYIDENDAITTEYQNAVKEGTVAPLQDSLTESIILTLPSELQEKAQAHKEEFVQQIHTSVHSLVQSVYDEKIVKSMFEDGNKSAKIENTLNDNFHKKAFQKLWKSISTKYGYCVDFESEELVKKSIASINENLHIAKLEYTKTVGIQKDTADENELAGQRHFKTMSTSTDKVDVEHTSSVEYDLLGKIVQTTKLRRKTVAEILCGMDGQKLSLFSRNPEEFIAKVARYILEQKASMIVEHITYTKSAEEPYSADIFTVSTKQDFSNAVRANRHIQDYVITDSVKEASFVHDIDIAEEVCVYAKLPRGFKIPTPVGDYSPDWAIAFHDEEKTKHIYFVAETKGSLESLQLRPIESAKISCAKKLFETMSQDLMVNNKERVKYDVVTTYEELHEKVFG